MTDRNILEHTIALSPESYRVLFEHIQDGVFVIRDATIILVNDICADMIGYLPEELVGQPIEQAIAPEDRAMVLERYRRRLAGDDVESTYEVRLLHKDGHTRRCVLMSVGISTDGGHTAVGTVKDITAIRTTLTELEHARKQYQTLRDTIADIFYRTDIHGVITDMSVAVFRALGYQPEEMIGHKLSEFYVNSTDRERVISAIRQHKGRATQVEAALRHRDGHSVWMSTNAYLTHDDSGMPSGVEGIARDITKRKMMEDELRTLSTHDDLTNSFNRRYFISAVEREIDRARRYGTTLSLLIIDVDLFKTVNDTYGHPTGDAILQQFATLCRKTLRKSDIFARMGGEEFAALMPETDQVHADRLCERLRREVESAHFSGADTTNAVHITISIGATTLQANDGSFGQLYARADSALYVAKSAGRNCCRFDTATTI